MDDAHALGALYATIDGLVADWRERTGVACPAGCGRCCEGFVPDCLAIEAEYVASYLLSQHPRRALELVSSPSASSEASGGCPFYDPTPEAHCSVYPARPLVCRLFGFAGTRDKHGRWLYRLCRWMPTPRGWGEARALAGPPRDGSRPWAARLADDLSAPPIMSDLEARVAGLRPAEAAERRPLPQAVRTALERLLLRDSLRQIDLQHHSVCLGRHIDEAAS